MSAATTSVAATPTLLFALSVDVVGGVGVGRVGEDGDVRDSRDADRAPAGACDDGDHGVGRRGGDR